jgi:TPR repeat protein
VPRNDLLAYKYFDELVQRFDEDDSDQRSLTAIANAFVQVGLYNLNGIPGTAVKPDPERAVELFEVAATRFGDADGQYHLARMFIEGAGGLDKEKGHRDAMAVLGHMLFRGDGVPRQAARGLMWLSMASLMAKSPKDAWIRDLESKDIASANEGERSAAAAFLSARGKREVAAALIAAHPTPPLQLSGASAPAQ